MVALYLFKPKTIIKDTHTCMPDIYISAWIIFFKKGGELQNLYFLYAKETIFQFQWNDLKWNVIVWVSIWKLNDTWDIFKQFISNKCNISLACLFSIFICCCNKSREKKTSFWMDNCCSIKLTIAYNDIEMKWFSNKNKRFSIEKLRKNFKILLGLWIVNASLFKGA